MKNFIIMIIIKNMSQNFGLERKWFDRVGFTSLPGGRFDFDEFIHPSKRTVSQKFEIQFKLAINKLVDLNLVYSAEADNILREFLRPLCADSGSMNGAAFALVFTCFDPTTRKLILQSKTKFNWQNILEYIKDPKKIKKVDNYGFDSFLKEYGITAADLVRYLVYLQNKFDI